MTAFDPSSGEWDELVYTFCEVSGVAPDTSDRITRGIAAIAPIIACIYARDGTAAPAPPARKRWRLWR